MLFTYIRAQVAAIILCAIESATRLVSAIDVIGTLDSCIFPLSFNLICCLLVAEREANLPCVPDILNGVQIGGNIVMHQESATRETQVNS